MDSLFPSTCPSGTLFDVTTNYCTFAGPANCAISTSSNYVTSTKNSFTSQYTTPIVDYTSKSVLIANQATTSSDQSKMRANSNLFLIFK